MNYKNWSEKAIEFYLNCVDFDAEHDESQPPYGFEFNSDKLVTNTSLIKGNYLISLEESWRLFCEGEVIYAEVQ